MDILVAIWNLDNVTLLAGGVVAAGVVRGFSGFGTAMIFLPISSSVISPVWSLIVLSIMDSIAPLLLSPRVARDASGRELIRLCIGAAVAMPFGIALLELLSSAMFRNSVSVLALILVAIMASGWRFRGKVSNPAVVGIGGLGGLLAGATGVPGPPVMLFYLARPVPPAIIRANIFLFLAFANLFLFILLAAKGWLSTTPVVMGLLATMLYFSSMVFGANFFNPNRESEYRFAAYVVIAAAAILGIADPLG